MNECRHAWRAMHYPGSHSHNDPVTVRCKFCDKTPGEAGALNKRQKEPLELFREWLTALYINDEDLEKFHRIKSKLEYFAMGGQDTSI